MCLKLHWNNLHILSKEKLCENAGVSKNIAKLNWNQIKKWLRLILKDSLQSYSKRKCTLE